MNSNPTFLRFTTAHYKFEMTITESKTILHDFYFIVGDKTKPCLEGNITLKNISNNSRYDDFENTARLEKINALQICSLDDITDNYMVQYSFGKELIEALIYFINSQFPTINTVSLSDYSYIPCIKDDPDTLDLLAYSIALHKKTWYEQQINAYILPKTKYEEYRKQVELYASKETKDNISFLKIYKHIKENSFANSIIKGNEEEYETIYNNAANLPEFFKELSKKIKREEKCRFFKGWLETFIGSMITIERRWYFDLFPKIEEIKILSKRRNTTRKNMSRK